MKLNCWEFKKCGRQPGGLKAEELGICPATTDSRLNGVHDGKNGGRVCWMIAGTLCTGKVEGMCGTRFEYCGDCSFYVKVRDEEGPNYELFVCLRYRLNGGARTVPF